MANTHTFETKFSKRMQTTFYNMPVFRALAGFEERSNLLDGQVVSRSYRSKLVAASYTRGSDMTIPDLTDTAETLTVNVAKVAPFSVDSLDELQSKYNLMNEYADDAMKEINAFVDGDFMGEVANATSSLDDGDLGGTSGNPISLTTANVTDVVFGAVRKLRELNIDVTGKHKLHDKLVNSGFVAASPRFMEQVELYNATRETAGGDEGLYNGYTGMKVSGLECYLTNNAYYSAVLGLATNPTNTDTLTIDGVTVTFVSAIGSTAGNVLIGANVDTTRASLAGLINNPTTTSATQVAVSSTRSDQWTLSDSEKFTRLTATNNDTTDKLTIVGEGLDYILLASSLTDATDGWDSEVQHVMIGRKGAVDMIIQAEPQVRTSDIPKQLGSYVKPYVLYGLKSFKEGARQMVDVQIDASSWA